MKKIYYITNRTPDGGYYFTEKRGQVFEVGGLSFGCLFNGRGLTVSELSTGFKVADVESPARLVEVVSGLLPVIKKALETEFAQKIAKDLKAHAAKQIKVWRYLDGKESARAAAIAYQEEAARRAQSYEETQEAGERFARLARRFGLVREFRENGII